MHTLHWQWGLRPIKHTFQNEQGEPTPICSGIMDTLRSYPLQAWAILMKSVPQPERVEPVYRGGFTGRGFGSETLVADGLVGEMVGVAG